MFCSLFLFFKQKTAYDMRISDLSSDVCSSDLFWQWNGSCFHQLDKDFLYLYVANNVTDSPIVRRDSDYRAVVNVLQRMCKGMLVQGDDRGINFAHGFVGEDLFVRSEEHTSELQSLMRIAYAVFCLKKKIRLCFHDLH